MSPNDKICYCCNVSLRKLINFARRERPRRVSQMTSCLGAGTGCGWCIPVLRKIAEDPDGFLAADLDPEEYVTKRSSYLSTGQPKNRF